LKIFVSRLSVGFCFLISYSLDLNLRFEYGIIYSDANQENSEIKMPNRINGRMILKSEIPADLKLDNSYFSPRFPKTMTDASNTPIGKAIGNRDIDKYRRNSITMSRPVPLPNISSI